MKRYRRYAKSGARLGGIICNARDTVGERELTSAFAEAIGSRLLGFIPRDNSIQQAEIRRKTVIEYLPGSPASAGYRALSERLENNASLSVPRPMEMEDLEALLLRYACV